MPDNELLIQAIVNRTRTQGHILLSGRRLARSLRRAADANLLDLEALLSANIATLIHDVDATYRHLVPFPWRYASGWRPYCTPRPRDFDPAA